MQKPRIALVHDWLTGFAGAEQVLQALHELYPDAPIYTSIYDPTALSEFSDAEVRTTYLQQLPLILKWQKIAIPLMPQAFESLDLKEFDLIISSTTGYSKGVITHPGQYHLSYCHTPIRYIWHLGGDNRATGWLKSRVAHSLRLWDVTSAQRVDSFIANSENVKERISKIYRRDSIVLYPPVNTERFKLLDKPRDTFLLAVGRLVAYKRTDLAIKAAIKLKKRLIIVGEGPEKANLVALASGHDFIEFLGRVSDEQLQELYSTAEALVFPGEEDFGIVPVEAMSAGCPVIAFNKGGATETVKPGVTGLLFDEQSSESIAECIQKLAKEEFDSGEIRLFAEGFDTQIFKEKFSQLVNDLSAKYLKK